MPPFIGLMNYPADLTTRNKQSWTTIVAFYEDLLTSDYAGVARPLLLLVTQLASSPRAGHFRAGQSLWHLIVSTAVQHGLTEHDPFVVVSIDDNNQYQIKFHERSGKISGSVAVCDANEVLEQLDVFLTRLWTETRGKLAERPWC